MPSLVKTQLFCARSKIGGRGVYFREDRTFRGFIEHGTGTMEVEIVSSQEEFPKRIFSLDEFLKRPSNLTEKHPQNDFLLFADGFITSDYICASSYRF